VAWRATWRTIGAAQMPSKR